MKRSGEQVQNGSQPKRQGSAPPVTSNGQELTTQDALKYLKLVKTAFQDNKPKYDQFLAIMKDFKTDRIRTIQVIERVKELFEGQENLILGFNTFLPAGYEIKLPFEDPVKKPMEFKEAISFVNKIKVRFQTEDQVYKSFLEILSLYRKESKTISEVYQEVSALFHKHPDLLVEFSHFLPDTTVAAANNYAVSAITAPYNRNSAIPVQNVDKEKTNGRLADSGQSVDGLEHDNDRGAKTDKEQSLGEKNGHGSKDIDLVGDKYSNMGQLSNHHDVTHKIEREGRFDKEIIFCEEVKKLLNPSEFSQFLKCLHIYNKDIITRKELESLVGDLTRREAGTMGRFKDFLTHCENIDEFLAMYSDKLKSNEENGARSAKPEDREARERDRLDRSPGFGNKENTEQKYPVKDKYTAKPISELDLSDCECCTPSYRLLPSDYPIPVASQRSQLAAQVLNDHWVSVTSGSEDYSFKHMRKNQYEESLFRCEDDRFEMDMLLESVNVTIKRVEELLAKIDCRTFMTGESLRIEEHLNALNLRTIDRLYGDHALDVMEVLKKNAALALPVVFTRLKQKQEEWIRCRADFKKAWADIYAKNYHKSLDHRSFYFKQQDTKSLSTKALLLEIKDLYENSHKEENALSVFDVGNRWPLKPNLEYEYADPDIHEDVYQLVKYSCGEVCTSEQLDKTMKIWTSFVEPIFGISPRPDEPEDSDDALDTKSHDDKDGDAPSSDSDCCPASRAGCKKNELASSLKKVEKHELSSSCRGWSVDRVKENGSSLDCSAHKSDSTSVSHKPTKFQLNFLISPSSVSIQASSNEPRVDASFINGTEDKISMGSASDRLANMSRLSNGGVDSGISLKAGEGERSTPIVNGSSVGKNQEVCAGHGKADREEGELSPNGDFGDDNFVTYGDAAVEQGQKTNDSTSSRPHKKIGDSTRAEAGGKNEVAAQNQGEESPQRSSEDSDNASENGEVKGSDSGEECIREHEEEGNNDGDDNKAESDGEAIEMDDAHDLDGEGNSVPDSERFISTVKPLAKYVPQAFKERKRNSRVFFGNDSLYVLFRLHQTLYERIQSAKINSSSTEKKWKSLNDDCPTDQYERFMNALYSLLDGSSDNNKFEDDCRSIIGTQSYVLFTLGKLIFKLVKQLQMVANDEMDNKLVQLYAYENSRKPEQFVDSVYHENARVLLHDGNVYRIECSSPPSRLSIQLMDCKHDKPEMTAVSIEPNFALYLHNDFLEGASRQWEKTGVLLKRNKRRNHFVNEAILEGVRIFNGLECKLACTSSKVSYVLDTEDLLYRPRRARRALYPHRNPKPSTEKPILGDIFCKLFQPKSS